MGLVGFHVAAVLTGNGPLVRFWSGFQTHVKRVRVVCVSYCWCGWNHLRNTQYTHTHTHSVLEEHTVHTHTQYTHPQYTQSTHTHSALDTQTDSLDTHSSRIKALSLRAVFVLNLVKVFA